MIHIAHRGAPRVRRNAPNSPAAFAAARAVGFTHVETDLRRHHQGHLVLAHDEAEVDEAFSLDAAWIELRHFDWINLELKELAVVAPLAGWFDREVGDPHLRARFVLSAFDAQTLAAAGDALPRVKLAGLLPPGEKDLRLPPGVSPASIHLAKEDAVAHPEPPSWLKERDAMAFTVNDLEWKNRLPFWVSGIFTDVLLPKN